jgi:DNA-binding PadR family transcriptional regulator
LQFAILMKMSKGSMYGYSVLKELRDHFQGVWEPQTGALYPALKKLQDHGLLVSEVSEEDDKEYYHLSEEGEEWLRESVFLVNGGAMMSLRFTSLIIETHEYLGLPSPPEDHGACSKMEKRQRLLHVREHLERDLERINEYLEMEEE